MYEIICTVQQSLILQIKAAVFIVYVQIFEGCKFCGQSKSRIFVVFKRIICYQPLCSLCIVIDLKKIEDCIFVDDN